MDQSRPISATNSGQGTKGNKRKRRATAPPTMTPADDMPTQSDWLDVLLRRQPHFPFPPTAMTLTQSVSSHNPTQPQHHIPQQQIAEQPPVTSQDTTSVALERFDETMDAVIAASAGRRLPTADSLRSTRTLKPKAKVQNTRAPRNTIERTQQVPTQKSTASTVALKVLMDEHMVVAKTVVVTTTRNTPPDSTSTTAAITNPRLATSSATTTATKHVKPTPKKKPALNIKRYNTTNVGTTDNKKRQRQHNDSPAKPLKKGKTQAIKHKTLPPKTQNPKEAETTNSGLKSVKSRTKPDNLLQPASITHVDYRDVIRDTQKVGPSDPGHTVKPTPKLQLIDIFPALEHSQHKPTVAKQRRKSTQMAVVTPPMLHNIPAFPLVDEIIDLTSPQLQDRCVAAMKTKALPNSETTTAEGSIMSSGEMGTSGASLPLSGTTEPRKSIPTPKPSPQRTHPSFPPYTTTSETETGNFSGFTDVSDDLFADPAIETLPLSIGTSEISEQTPDTIPYQQVQASLRLTKQVIQLRAVKPKHNEDWMQLLDPEIREQAAHIIKTQKSKYVQPMYFVPMSYGDSENNEISPAQKPQNYQLLQHRKKPRTKPLERWSLMGEYHRNIKPPTTMESVRYTSDERHSSEGYESDLANQPPVGYEYGAPYDVTLPLRNEIEERVAQYYRLVCCTELQRSPLDFRPYNHPSRWSIHMLLTVIHGDGMPIGKGLIAYQIGQQHELLRVANIITASTENTLSCAIVPFQIPVQAFNRAQKANNKMKNRSAPTWRPHEEPMPKRPTPEPLMEKYAEAFVSPTMILSNDKKALFLRYFCIRIASGALLIIHAEALVHGLPQELTKILDSPLYIKTWWDSDQLNRLGLISSLGIVDKTVSQSQTHIHLLTCYHYATQMKRQNK